MKGIQALQNKRASKKGFTLAEMLIVIAIIAILIAIAIPIFNKQLTDAQSRVEEANERAAKSIAYADYLLNDGTTKDIVVDAEGNILIKPADVSGMEIVKEYTVTIDTDGKPSIATP